MVLSWYAAAEFAESLRLALRLYPSNAALVKVAKGELNTKNLKFDGYDKSGDHADFLWFFIEKHKTMENMPKPVLTAGGNYIKRVRKLREDVRAVSIVSREQELPGIFRRILSAKNWSLPELSAFEYYLKKHIELDSGPRGHAAILSEFTTDDRLVDFYKLRLDMYRVLPVLFT